MSDVLLKEILGKLNNLEVNMVTKHEFRLLQKDVQVLKGDVQVLKGDVQVLKGDVQVLKEEVGALREAVTVLQGDVLFSHKKLDTISVQVAQGTEKGHELSTRVADHETDIKLLKRLMSNQ